ncbi:MAG TPA: CpsD/CapB family tyrosine-protein kinase [Acidobacteriaceae bacterium]|jgi:capsular exopolysaccharide synthesis family protein|nr:CpsD/CapB family tyrosine-protein kinase [Acidobacteriaceae bacterium]
MSRIFDALLRSEAERSGADASRLSGATELLEQAERHAVSEAAVVVGPRAATGNHFDVATEEFADRSGPDRSTMGGGLLTSERREEFDEVQTLPLPSGLSAKLVSLGDQDGPAAEAFRFLGVRLRHIRRERTLKKLLITSTIPQEGKSLVAANVASTLSLQSSQRMVLVEGDLRRPSLTDMFGVQGKPGLCEWMRDECELTSCMYQIVSPRMWLLPAGCSAGNYLELLQSGKIANLVEHLAESFDWVVIDSPPILPLADTSIWSRLADGILLVTRQGKTEKRQLQRGLEAIESQKLIGAVLNSSSSPAHGDYYYTRRKTAGASELSIR